MNNQGCLKILWDGAVDAGVLITNACVTSGVTVAATSAINPFAGIAIGFVAGMALDASGDLARRDMKAWVK